jgi:hypothetical protein
VQWRDDGEHECQLFERIARARPQPADGISTFLRNGTMTGASDIEFTDNAIDLRCANDTRNGLDCTGVGINGLRVRGNVIQTGSRGMNFSDCSHTTIHENEVFGSTSAGLILASTAGAISDIDISRNHLESVTAFKPAIQISGSHDVSRCKIDFNRLISLDFSVLNSLSAGTFNFRYRYNSHSQGLHSSAVPAGSDSATNYQE